MNTVSEPTMFNEKLPEVSSGPAEVRERGLEKHIVELCHLEDTNPGGEPCSGVLPEAASWDKGEEETKHPRYNYSKSNRSCSIC